MVVVNFLTQSNIRALEIVESQLSTHIIVKVFYGLILTNAWKLHISEACYRQEFLSRRLNPFKS